MQSNNSETENNDPNNERLAYTTTNVARFVRTPFGETSDT